LKICDTDILVIFHQIVLITEDLVNQKDPLPKYVRDKLDDNDTYFEPKHHLEIYVLVLLEKENHETIKKDPNEKNLHRKQQDVVKIEHNCHHLFIEKCATI